MQYTYTSVNYNGHQYMGRLYSDGITLELDEVVYIRNYREVWRRIDPCGPTATKAANANGYAVPEDSTTSHLMRRERKRRQAKRDLQRK